jgi:hypothetical protein
VPPTTVQNRLLRSKLASLPCRSIPTGFSDLCPNRVALRRVAAAAYAVQAHSPLMTVDTNMTIRDLSSLLALVLGMLLVLAA